MSVRFAREFSPTFSNITGASQYSKLRKCFVMTIELFCNSKDATICIACVAGITGEGDGKRENGGGAGEEKGRETPARKTA